MQMRSGETADLQDLYVRQDERTDPGGLVDLYRDLPDTVPQLRDIVSGLIVHVSWAERYGIPADVPLTRATRPVADRLRLIEDSFPGSLTEARPPLKRTFGTCRDYALLLCSMLRSRAIPARVRCGFAAYLAADTYQDHWICEYWSPGTMRWVQVDAQLDRPQVDQLGITFDCADLPPGAFITAARAWLSARDNSVAAEAFGHGGTTGFWFLSVNLHRDVLSLTNREVSAWDTWRDAPLTAKVLGTGALAELDQLADAVTAFEDGSEQFAFLQEAASRNAIPPWLL
ncbi:transglutaminase domain-containing protein [Bradyrhizobium sp. ORS 86]|uniref:transglutaminase domain-containing protein n=1 Tax=Bradyrhizobium sp. ORS 86 TaxID=1685970 RepID=UPI00388D7E0D